MHLTYHTKQQTLLDFKVLQQTQERHFLICNSKTTPQLVWQQQLHLNNSTQSQAKIQKFQSITQNWHSTEVFAIAVRAAVKISISQSFSIRMSKEQAGQVNCLHHCYFSFFFLQMGKHYKDNLTMIQIQNKRKSFEQ